MSRADRRGEAGAATAVVLGAASVLLLVTLLAATGARVLVAHREAGAVADLGALAGAVAVQHGRDGCEVARRHVSRSGAAVVDCRVSADHVRLRVRVDLGELLGRRVGVGARAHAGPR